MRRSPPPRAIPLAAVATAPGKKPWQEKRTATEQPARLEVSIPPLRDLAPLRPLLPPPATPAPPPDAPPSRSGRSAAFVGAGALAAGALTYLLWPAPEAKQAGSAVWRAAPVASAGHGGLVLSGTF